MIKKHKDKLIAIMAFTLVTAYLVIIATVVNIAYEEGKKWLDSQQEAVK